MRYAAVACVVAGGMFMGGAGAVAFAEPGTDGTGGSTVTDGTGTQTSDTGPTPGGFSVSRLPILRWFTTSPTSKRPRVGPISPPVMILPPRLGSTTSPNGVQPAGQQPSGAAISPDVSQPANVVGGIPALEQAPQDGNQAPSTPASPTISLLPLVPPGVPVGPPLRIKNPLPDQLPIDLTKPIVPQLLPSPLVVILMAVEGRVPLAGLLISPVMNATVPPFFADVVIALLSDIMVPTLPLGAIVPDPTIPNPVSLLDSAALSMSLPASGPPPPEIAPMGMDVPQAPAPEPTPAPPPVGPPQRPNPPDNHLAPLSEQVAFRAGYSDYLRNAGMAQITAIAAPGAVAILLFSVGGGVIGYRQARAGHVIRAEGIARFLR